MITGECPEFHQHRGEHIPAWHREREVFWARLQFGTGSRNYDFYSPDGIWNIAVPCRKALTSHRSEVQIIRGREILIWGDERESQTYPAGLRENKRWDLRALCKHTKRAAFRRERNYLGSFTEESAAAVGKNGEVAPSSHSSQKQIWSSLNNSSLCIENSGGSLVVTHKQATQNRLGTHRAVLWLIPCLQNPLDSVIRLQTLPGRAQSSGVFILSDVLVINNTLSWLTTDLTC